jgi:hypothetical protein
VKTYQRTFVLDHGTLREQQWWDVASLTRRWKESLPLTSRAREFRDLFLSLRSRREHRAWGVSPRKLWFQVGSQRERAKDLRTNAVAPCHGLRS